METNLSKLPKVLESGVKRGESAFSDCRVSQTNSAEIGASERQIENPESQERRGAHAATLVAVEGQSLAKVPSVGSWSEPNAGQKAQNFMTDIGCWNRR